MTHRLHDGELADADRHATELEEQSPRWVRIALRCLVDEVRAWRRVGVDQSSRPPSDDEPPHDGGFAVVKPHATNIVVSFIAAPTDDPEITCVICGSNEVTHEFGARRRDGARVVIGIHEGCNRTLVGFVPRSSDVHQRKAGS